MGKQLRIYEVMVSSDNVRSKPFELVLKDKVISVAISNMDVSPDRLLIGWNENPSTKNYLNPDTSKPYGAREPDYLTGNTLKAAFENSDPSNQGLVTVTYETDQDVC